MPTAKSSHSECLRVLYGKDKQIDLLVSEKDRLQSKIERLTRALEKAQAGQYAYGEALDPDIKKWISQDEVTGDKPSLARTEANANTGGASTTPRPNPRRKDEQSNPTRRRAD